MMFDDEFCSPKVFTPNSCLSRELQEELNRKNMLTVKTRGKVCRLLDDLAVESDEIEKRESLRIRAIKEVLETEKTYIKSLEKLINQYIIPLKPILDHSTHNTLFGHIEMIHNLNRELLMELEADLNNVGSAFLRLGPFLKLYSVYAFDYKKVLLTLQELQDKNTKFKSFLDRTETRPDVQAKLNSLLILPIQRVPRYKLLLQQVLLYTSPTERDFRILQDSVKQMESTANHINSLVEDQENTQMMLNLQNSLVSRCPRIIEPCRKLIREGVLFKVTKRGDSVRRYCILMSDIFMYCRIWRERNPGTVVDNSLECCCIFPLKKCRVTETIPGTFKIKCQDDELVLQTTDNEALSRQWVMAIKEAVEQHIEYRRTLRKESSRRLPLRKKRDLKNLAATPDDELLSPRRSSVYENVFKMMTRSDDDTSDSSLDGPLLDFNCLKRRHRRRTTTKRKAAGEGQSNGSSTFTGSGTLAAKRARTDLVDTQLDDITQDQENLVPESLENLNQIEDTQAKKRRSVRFSDVQPVPFKYDDDQEYLNSKFLERTTPRKTIVKDTLPRRIWNFFNNLF